MSFIGRVVVLVSVAVVVAFSSPAAAAGLASDSATIKEEANLRAQPNTSSKVLALLPAGTVIDVLCWRQGEPTYGSDKYGSMWLYTSRGGWVHSKLATPVDVEECGSQLGLVPGGFYENCDAARAAGVAPLPATEPGYGPHLDSDNDGIGCERDE